MLGAGSTTSTGDARQRHRPHLLPPGTILQHMYLRERLTYGGPRSRPGRFIEVGFGEGHLSRLLLDLGWSGTAYDLCETAAERARIAFAPDIADGRYVVRAGNWLESSDIEKVDLVISCMVLEHLDEADEELYIHRCNDVLKPDGVLVLLVPGSPRHWGVEDEIAGHYRRYSLEGIRCRLDGLGWQVTHSAGLCYPVSNVLLPVSNWLVERAERDERDLSMYERTKASGHRRVAMKTSFPPIARLVLNERFLRPMHYLQKRNRNNPNSLVVYVDARRSAATE